MMASRLFFAALWFASFLAIVNAAALKGDGSQEFIKRQRTDGDIAESCSELEGRVVSGILGDYVFSFKKTADRHTLITGEKLIKQRYVDSKIMPTHVLPIRDSRIAIFYTIDGEPHLTFRKLLTSDDPTGWSYLRLNTKGLKFKNANISADIKMNNGIVTIDEKQILEISHQGYVTAFGNVTDEFGEFAPHCQYINAYIEENNDKGELVTRSEWIERCAGYNAQGDKATWFNYLTGAGLKCERFLEANGTAQEHLRFVLIHPKSLSGGADKADPEGYEDLYDSGKLSKMFSDTDVAAPEEESSAGLYVSITVAIICVVITVGVLYGLYTVDKKRQDQAKNVDPKGTKDAKEGKAEKGEVQEPRVTSDDMSTDLKNTPEKVSPKTQTESVESAPKK